MSESTASPADAVRPLLRVRQYRDFTSEPVDPAAVDAIVDAGRWSGSSRNEQPWRFIVLRDVPTIRRIAEIGRPHTRGMESAPVAIAVVLPIDPSLAEMRAFDEGRAVERMLIAASFLGLGAGVQWIPGTVLPPTREVLGLPDDRLVRSIVAIGHPTEAARAPKAAAGQGRLPRSETVIDERWPGAR